MCAGGSPSPRARIPSVMKKANGRILTAHLSCCGFAILTTGLVARYRDDRLTLGLSTNTVRLELALLSHLYRTAIRERGYSKRLFLLLACGVLVRYNVSRTQKGVYYGYYRNGPCPRG